LFLAYLWAAAETGTPAVWTFHPLDDPLRLAREEQRRLFLCFGRDGCPACAIRGERSPVLKPTFLPEA
jgi:thioredoxin-related protein